jgi:hypothetical protein
MPPPPGARLKNKSVLLDAASAPTVCFVGVAYVTLLLVCIIIGATGPPAVLFSSNPAADADLACAEPASCELAWPGRLTDMTPLHQLMWLQVRLERPLVPSTGVPALLSVPVPVTLSYSMDVTARTKAGEAVVLVNNASHAVHSFCAPGALLCDSAVIFAQADLSFPTYELVARFHSPLSDFALGVPLAGARARLHFVMGYINPSYTTFEIGVKMFFVAATGIVWLAYSMLLCGGPGTHDDDDPQVKLRTSPEQAFVWWLGLFLILFNDPLFPLALDKPDIAFAGFAAFSTVTFVTSLLFYFVVQLDLMRMQGEGGLHFFLDPHVAAEKLGVCFWLPKAIFLAVFWTASLAAFMLQRVMIAQDPTYNVVEANPRFAAWLGTFIAVMAGLYLAYFASLLVLSLRHYASMRPANRFTLCITLITLVVLACGVFLNFFTSVRSDSALMLSLYGAANLYVWTLSLAFVPAPRAPQWVREALGRGGDGSERYEGGDGGGMHELHEAEDVAVDTTGVLGDGGLEEAQEDGEGGGEEGDEGAAPAEEAEEAEEAEDDDEAEEEEVERQVRAAMAARRQQRLQRSGGVPPPPPLPPAGAAGSRKPTTQRPAGRRPAAPTQGRAAPAAFVIGENEGEGEGGEGGREGAAPAPAPAGRGPRGGAPRR